MSNGYTIPYTIRYFMFLKLKYQGQYSTFKRPKALLTTVSGDLKSQCLLNGIFCKVKNFVFVALKCYLHSVPNKTKTTVRFLTLCKIQNRKTV